MQGTVQAMTVSNREAMQETVRAITEANSANSRETLRAVTEAANANNRETLQALVAIRTDIRGVLQPASDHSSDLSQVRRPPRERTPTNPAISRHRASSLSSESEGGEPERENSGSFTTQSSYRSRATKLPVFTGKEGWKIWFNRFGDVATRRGWNEEEKLDEIVPLLQGPAGEFVFGSLSPQTRSNYVSLTAELENRFHVVETTRTFTAKFHRRVQLCNESVEEYALDLKHLYDKAFAHRKAETRQEDLLRQFLGGLYDNKARFQVEYVKDPRTIDEAVEYVISYLEMQRLSAKQEKDYPQNFRRPARKISSPNSSDVHEDRTTDYDEEDEHEHDVVRQQRAAQNGEQQEERKTSSNEKTDNLLQDYYR